MHSFMHTLKSLFLMTLWNSFVGKARNHYILTSATFPDTPILKYMNLDPVNKSEVHYLISNVSSFFFIFVACELEVSLLLLFVNWKYKLNLLVQIKDNTMISLLMTSVVGPDLI